MPGRINGTFATTAAAEGPAIVFGWSENAPVTYEASLGEMVA